MEDWALIRRLVAGGVPQRQVAKQLGVARATVARAVGSAGPPKYERVAGANAFTPFEARVRALLAEHPALPGTVLAERIGWSGSITWFREQAARPAALTEQCPSETARFTRVGHLVRQTSPRLVRNESAGGQVTAITCRCQESMQRRYLPRSAAETMTVQQDPSTAVSGANTTRRIGQLIRT